MTEQLNSVNRPPQIEAAHIGHDAVDLVHCLVVLQSSGDSPGYQHTDGMDTPSYASGMPYALIDGNLYVRTKAVVDMACAQYPHVLNPEIAASYVNRLGNSGAIQIAQGIEQGIRLTANGFDGYQQMLTNVLNVARENGSLIK